MERRHQNIDFIPRSFNQSRRRHFGCDGGVPSVEALVDARRLVDEGEVAVGFWVEVIMVVGGAWLVAGDGGD